MKKYRIYQVDSFTTQKLYGNPAGVVTNADGLNDEQMQRIARELNNSETAFILSPKDASHDVWVRFFTPTSEVPICGHATIAAHYARAIELGLDSTKVVQKTGAGNLLVDINRCGNDYSIVMTQGEIKIGEPFSWQIVQKLTEALGIKSDDLNSKCPVCIASTGHSKVMITINSNSVLHSLKPNFELLISLSKEIGCNGYYVFTLDQNAEILVHGRMFAPAIGINEDPVTGNANGPLGAYLVHYELFGNSDLRSFKFKAMQGEAIGRTGVMEVNVTKEGTRPTLVQITGRAVIVFSAELEV
ncbi:PhzF family isomerase [Campylobacter fetus]|uniref:PhzF family isomerase n=1 Tax=Campylobacter fetus TaxID=196 RepID=UPI00127C0CA5|nr:PhzF family isomerase [Campylobacter fetus]WKW17112.1 PhzF family isomerase [Campylobacter fetus subsp. fetus]EAJ5693626.1 PhzF family isomerase [Campylobacter fetus]EAJ5703787.1 PhzF family isomerase [Campylobacter fetus]EAJ9256450.1 PhzF family isomerase [Campylobacter fetus]EAK0815388.1 PhzF family isomerase [Campylobacter fetus]